MDKGPVRLAWRFFLDAGHESAAQKLLDRILAHLDTEVLLVEMERYWKDEKQHVLTLETPLVATSFPEAITEALQLHGRLFHGAEVSIPSNGAGAWTFDGAGASGRVSGLRMATWSLVAGARP